MGRLKKQKIKMYAATAILLLAYLALQVSAAAVPQNSDVAVEGGERWINGTCIGCDEALDAFGDAVGKGLTFLIIIILSPIIVLCICVCICCKICNKKPQQTIVVK